jgi:formate hydrogenlyase subunit 3/multisubunit Na+/H+ antiporter MnhD subunit
LNDRAGKGSDGILKAFQRRYPHLLVKYPIFNKLVTIFAFFEVSYSYWTNYAFDTATLYFDFIACTNDPNSTRPLTHPLSMAVMFVSQALMILFYGLFVVYDSILADGKTTIDDSRRGAVQQVYPFYQDVHVMIFIGFGYLMVFLRKNAYSSLGWTFLVACFSIQWYILMNGFWENAFSGESHWSNISVNLSILCRADFAAAAVLITYGVILGKVTFVSHDSDHSQLVSE